MFEKGNRFSVGHGFGRPPKYETVEDMEKEINGFFEWAAGEYKEKQDVVRDAAGKPVLENGKPIPLVDEFGDPVMIKKWIRKPEIVTITGLALYLGFSSRQSLIDAGKRGTDFSDAITRGKCRVEMDYEARLAERDKQHGAQFALMNMGWAVNNRTGVVNKDNELVDPPRQVIIVNGKEIEF